MVTDGPGVTMMGLSVVTRSSASELFVTELVTRTGSGDSSFCSAKYLDGDQTVRKHNDSAENRHETSGSARVVKEFSLIGPNT